MRAVVSEGIHKIVTSGGKVVSVTTDGFLTDQNIISPASSVLQGEIAQIFMRSRKELTGVAEIYEEKLNGVGLISTTTRGQLGWEKKDWER